MRIVFRPLLLILFLLLGWVNLHAEWVLDGVPLCSSDSDQWYGYIATDDAGGAIIAWSDVRNDINL